MSPYFRPPYFHPTVMIPPTVFPLLYFSTGIEINVMSGIGSGTQTTWYGTVWYM